MSARLIIVGAVLALATFTVADHGLRKMQANECGLGDGVMPCPDKLWWFEESCSTDSVCAALAPPARLVGFGCEGAYGPLYANEEDDFPLCERIEPAE